MLDAVTGQLIYTNRKHQLASCVFLMILVGLRYLNKKVFYRTGQMRNRLVIKTALSFAFWFLLSCGGQDEQLIRIGKPAPNFHYTLVEGSPGSIQGLKGKVALVRFWADWCPSCRTEMPLIDRFYLRLKEKGFDVLAINVGQSREVLVAFRAEMNLHFPMAQDPEGRLARSYGVRGIPQNFLIDREGIIRGILMGDIFTDEKVLRDLLRPYFPESDLTKLHLRGRK